MKTFLMLLAMWHGWRAAVWFSRMMGADTDTIESAAKVMHDYHSSRTARCSECLDKLVARP